MLRGEVISHPRVIDNCQRDDPFFPRPRQCGVAREQNGETSSSDQNGNNYKPNWLSPKKRTIGFGAVSQIRAAKPVADPKQGGEREVEGIERTRFRVGVSLGEPEGDRREPERAHHPEAVPDGSPHPASLGIQRGCLVRRSSKEGGGFGQISHETIELDYLDNSLLGPAAMGR